MQYYSNKLDLICNPLWLTLCSPLPYMVLRLLEVHIQEGNECYSETAAGILWQEKEKLSWENSERLSETVQRTRLRHTRMMTALSLWVQWINLCLYSAASDTRSFLLIANREHPPRHNEAA